MPTASAILTVLYPKEFTVYDARVCGSLGDFSDLAYLNDFEKLWYRYEKFLEVVRAAVPLDISLRDKDRYLWGKSFYEQLKADIERGFGEPGSGDE